jgi:H+/Cl- antiporter ClcA
MRPWLQRIAGYLDESRIGLARPDSLLPLALLGLVTGVIAGGVIVAFRLLVEGLQVWLLPGDNPENYEGLSGWPLFVLPALAGVLLALMFRWFGRGQHVLGVARLLECMQYHQGRCSLRAFWLQFAGAGIAIAGGHSVGREGPHIFLGGAAGSLLGQRLGLPHNAIRALAGCGSAAGIAASFNTPLAGVVFALEVVMMEYSVASFIPVILAAVSATTLSRWVFGDAPAFDVPVMHLGSLHELWLVLLLGVVAGVVSALFVSAVRRVAAQSRPWSIEARLVLAGVLMGGCGWLVPEVMGIGYDTVGLALNGGLALGLLTILLVGKLVATTLCIGLGVPGGVIGPTLFIGAVLGALLAGAAAATPLGGPDQVGLFALLGMGAMMSASLQAPLAALTAILELTDNPETILPGMLAVVVAGLTAKVAFGQDSLFLTMLRAGGLDYAPNPVSQALRRIGVAGVMQRRIIVLDAQLTRGRLREALKSNPVYVLVRTGEGGLQTLPAVDLVRQLGDDPGMDPEDPVDLSEVPADRLATGDIDLRASLHEAWLALEDGTVDALLVRRGRLDGPVRGVLTREAVEGAYRVA